MTLVLWIFQDNWTLYALIPGDVHQASITITINSDAMTQRTFNESRAPYLELSRPVFRAESTVSCACSSRHRAVEHLAQLVRRDRRGNVVVEASCLGQRRGELRARAQALTDALLKSASEAVHPAHTQTRFPQVPALGRLSAAARLLLHALPDGITPVQQLFVGIGTREEKSREVVGIWCCCCQVGVGYDTKCLPRHAVTVAHLIKI